MSAAVLISAFALGVSAISFFYKIGRDSKQTQKEEPQSHMLSQIYKTTETINKKLDDIAEWQRKAAEIHASHEERIKTLFTNIERMDERISLIDSRMDDREVMNRSLEKILERIG